MDLPENAIRKGIKSPTTAFRYVFNEIENKIRTIYDENIVTPLRAEYLFDHNFDIAIIIDACRYDMAADMIQNHSLHLEKPKQIYSAGSCSAQWIERTFKKVNKRELADTAYISGNVFTNKVPESELAFVDRVWKYGWDPEIKTVPPRPITDRTITSIRKDRAEQYVVHYMQPHLPPLDANDLDRKGFYPHEGDPARNRQGGGEWTEAKQGNPSPLINGYKNNLSAIYSELELILQNIDASEVIITSDHGNYLGERGRWGHPFSHTHEAVRNVPWWKTSGTNTGSYQPKEYDRSNQTVSKVESLKALGYL